MRQNLNNDLSLLKPAPGGLGAEHGPKTPRKKPPRRSRRSEGEKERDQAYRSTSRSSAHQLALPSTDRNQPQWAPPPTETLSASVAAIGMHDASPGPRQTLDPISFDRNRLQQSEHRPMAFAARRQPVSAKEKAGAAKTDPKLLYRYVLYSPCDEILHRIALILQ